jgi:hypothetical protein
LDGVGKSELDVDFEKLGSVDTLRFLSLPISLSPLFIKRYKNKSKKKRRGGRGE